LRFQILATIVAISAFGCLDSFEPETGPLLQNPCVNEDSNPDVEISFRADIRDAIFDRPDIDCVRCHTPGGETPIGLEATGFDVSNRDSVLRGGVNSGTGIVVPGQPCESLLILKVGPAPPIGSRMPLSGPPYLTDLDMEDLRDWIAEGARDN